ncbi:hypothetical protein M422DRAFT_253792 [Sphaerobolus stellatus SS14]|uniref:Major facilitator superfamily (MFS) profile domain-containing protein n=1 Tax=Sphaerobolus stellatus (strain SS14) TaxID=990650 RepID=A0A0C9UIY3_SPHS4|nr:hypothetical protein M422DRAFT_253792 [Sphaerobolus stellatus SS14]
MSDSSHILARGKRPAGRLPHTSDRDESTEQFTQSPQTLMEDPVMSLRSLVTVFASCLAYFSNQYSISAVGDVMNDADYREVVWFVNAASLVVMISGPAIAYYGDVKTRKWLILGGLLFGFLGQIISGLLRVMNVLIAGQAMVGVALATQPLLVSIPIEVLPQNKRRYAQLAANIAGEIWGTHTGLFNHRLFTTGRNFPIALLLFFIEGILFIVFLVWYNQEVYELYERDPLKQGLRFSVFYGAVTLLAPWVGKFCSRTKTVKPALLTGNVFLLAGSALMASAMLNSGRAVIGYVALVGVGMTAPLVTLMSTVHISAPVDLINTVAPLATMMRTFGIVAGNVLSDIIVNTQFTALLPSHLSAALTPLGISSGSIQALVDAFSTRITRDVKNAAVAEGISEEVLQAAHAASDKAQLDAFRVVWIAATALAASAVICCLCMARVNPPEPSGPSELG